MTRDPYRYFRIEAAELVAALSRDALALERTPADTSVVARMLRAAHTLKGAARVVRHTTAADLAHTLESILSPHRQGLVPWQALEEVLRVADALSAEVRGLEALPGEPARAPEEALDTVRVDVGELDRLLRALYELGVRLTALRAQADALARATGLARVASDQLLSRAPSSVRGVIDDLGESIATSRRVLTSGLDQVEIEVDEARETAERLRLLPAHAIVDVLERAVRDAAQSLGKRAQLRITGADTRLDAHVLFLVRNALMHVVRNAVAHGIERPPARAAAEKPPEGTIAIAIERRGRHVVFTCTDDGQGIDVDAVRSAALRRGLATAEELAAMPPERVIEILLHGGTSTATSVDAVSGRGIGLDVVRETITRLKGEIALTSEAGVGCRLVLSVPISLISITAVIVDVDQEAVAIPLSAVRSATRLGPQQVARGAGGNLVEIEGASIPLITLRALLGLPEQNSRDGAKTALVVQAGGEHAAVIVDRIRATVPVIVRRLPAIARAESIVAGAALDAEGAPQLVLDPSGIVRAARGVRIEPRSTRPRPAPVLVIDDSLTTRMLEQSILESAGYDVELATSAEEGLEKARSRTFSLFLVDVEMPGMDGFEFVARTRQDPTLSKVPAILVTSLGGAEDRKRGVDVGARAYVVKSEFDQGKLLDVIKELVA